MGYEVAKRVGLTMIGRATGRRYRLFTGQHRFRCTPEMVPVSTS